MKKILMFLSATCLFASHEESKINHLDLDLTMLADAYYLDKGSKFMAYHHYTRHYEQLFKERRFEINKVLELGLNIFASRSDCGSLRLWLDYFPNAQVYGVDIIPQSFKHERATVFTCDLSQTKEVDKLSNKLGDQFDIIIDDASHNSYDQQICFYKLFEKIKNDGFYIIEDLHYQPDPEPEDVIKTRMFFEKLVQGEFISVPNISDNEINRINKMIKEIRFFDSVYGGPKCLVTIQKN